MLVDEDVLAVFADLAGFESLVTFEDHCDGKLCALMQKLLDTYSSSLFDA